MINKVLKNKGKTWKFLACVCLCFLAAGIFSAAATAKEEVKTIVTVTASPVEMVQDGEMPKLSVKASVKGDSKTVLDSKTGYTVQDLLDSFKKGKNYQLQCEADGKTDGKFPITVKLSEKVENSLVREWLGKVKIDVKNGTFVVRNKDGEWKGDKFEKNDGSFAVNEFIISKGNKYYFGKDGKMLTGKHRLGMKDCEFAKDGRLIKEEASIDPNKPMLALTFDDGPGEGTERILETLELYGAKATFFMLGPKAEKYPDTVKKMQELGCELGNHTYSHIALPQLTKKEIRREIRRTSEAVAAASGGAGTTLVRPPYGETDGSVRESVGAPIIMWSVDTLDWKTRDTKSTMKAVLNSAEDGDIVLMHDIHEPTVEATVQMIPQLIEKGYQLVTVSELAEARGITLEDGERYSQFYK